MSGDRAAELGIVDRKQNLKHNTYSKGEEVEVTTFLLLVLQSYQTLSFSGILKVSRAKVQGHKHVPLSGLNSPFRYNLPLPPDSSLQGVEDTKCFN